MNLQQRQVRDDVKRHLERVLVLHNITQARAREIAEVVADLLTWDDIELQAALPGLHSALCVPGQCSPDCLLLPPEQLDWVTGPQGVVPTPPPLAAGPRKPYKKPELRVLETQIELAEFCSGRRQR